MLFSHSVYAEYLGEGIYIQRNAQNKSPRIAILTVIIGGKKADCHERFCEYTYEEMVSFGTKTKRAYAKKHGYDLIIATEKIPHFFGKKQTRDLEAAWTKVPLIARFLKEYDWVFWSDADSAFMNFNIRLEDFIKDPFDIIACDFSPDQIQPASMHSNQCINTGQVLYRNSCRTFQILSTAWDNHHDNIPGNFEQLRINNCLHKNKLEKYVFVFPQKSFNTHPDYYSPGDFLIHFYGHHGKELYEGFQELEKKYGYLVDLTN